MAKEEKEQENTLTKEIESWSKFEYALREDDMTIKEFKQATEVKKFDTTYWSIYLCYYNLKQYEEAKKYLVEAYNLNKNPKYFAALLDPILNPDNKSVFDDKSEKNTI